MLVNKLNAKISCDLVGCGNLAEFSFKLSPSTYDCYALNLCGKCLSCMVKGYKSITKNNESKEKVNEEKR